MKFITPQISWHSDREPIYGVDVQPSQTGEITRLATCGADKFVRLWEVKLDGASQPTVAFLSSLNKHNRTVNAVRFSPDGKLLASGGDDAVIILWKRNESTPPANNIFEEDDDDCRENWSFVKALRSHIEDVYDLCWSSDGNRLVSGSIDNSAILWDVNKGCRLHILTEHKGFVQGVAFDPLLQYLATMSNDRSMRVFNTTTDACVHNVRSLANHSADGEKTKPHRLFHDDTVKSFFRRLAFSPDGQLLVVPTGRVDVADKNVNTTFVFTRSQLTKPVLHLPVPQHGVTFAVRFCPVIFELRPIAKRAPLGDINENREKQNDDVQMKDADGKSDETETPDSLFKLPYRMIFAVLSEAAILFYDTQQQVPFAIVSNIHYMSMTDLSWSSDGHFLVVSSTDGYCSLISFAAGELGRPYTRQADDLIGRKTSESSAAVVHPGEVKSSGIAVVKPSDIVTNPKPGPVKIDTRVNSDLPKPRRVTMTTLCTANATPRGISTCGDSRPSSDEANLHLVLELSNDNS